MSVDINKMSGEGKDFLSELGRNLGNAQDQSAVLRILTTVLHSFRESIAVTESKDFISRLPDFLKDIYEDQWDQDEKIERQNDVADLQEKVIEEQAKWSEGDFGKDIPSGKMIKTVFDTVEKYTTNGNDNIVNTALLIAYCIE